MFLAIIWFVFYSGKNIILSWDRTVFIFSSLINVCIRGIKGRHPDNGHIIFVIQLLIMFMSKFNTVL